VEGDDRAGEALGHLQAAAREAIAAARAFLDVADELVADPKAAAAIADAVGSVIRTAARKGREAAGVAGHDDDEGDDRVQRIRIS
jgi:hypothetical protein